MTAAPSPSFRSYPTAWAVYTTTPGFSSHVVGEVQGSRGSYRAYNAQGQWLRDCATKGAAISVVKRAWLRSHA